MYPSCDFVVSFPPHKTLHLIPPSIPLGGVNYTLAPDYTVPWRKRTKAQSGCLRTYDGHTDPDSGHFGSPTHAFNNIDTILKRPAHIILMTETCQHESKQPAFDAIASEN